MRRLARMAALAALAAAFLPLLSSCNPDEEKPKFLSKEEIEEIHERQKNNIDLDKYVEFRPGDCPVVFTVPHGGTLIENSLTLRSTSNCPDPDFATDLDYNTRELADDIDGEFFRQTGHHPYMVIAIIKRNHVDFNRKKAYAVPSGDEKLAKVYDRYHTLISNVLDTITRTYGHGLLLDVHGQSHSEQIDIGYLLPVSTLNLNDNTLNGGTYAANSSINHLYQMNKNRYSYAQILRGDKSLGARLYANGLECVPRPGNDTPGSTPYFNGGYTTLAYGSRNGGVIDAIQLEFRYSYRDLATERKKAATATVKSINEFTSALW